MSLAVLTTLVACTGARDQGDVTDLESLASPQAALAWLAAGDNTSLEDRDVSARLAGLVTDAWPDDGKTAADVLTSALVAGPDEDDRARLTAQLVHLLAHEDLAEDAVREAAATVLATRPAELRKIVAGRGPTGQDGWTSSVAGDPPGIVATADDLADALEELGNEGLVVLTALAHERHGEMVEVATGVGEPRTMRNLSASGADGALTDGRATGAAMNLVLTRSFEDAEARLAALSTAVQVASAAPIDATAVDLAVAVDETDTVLIPDASRLMDMLTINALLEAGFLDIDVDPNTGLPPETLVDGRLDPLLFDGDVSIAADPTAPDRISLWLVSYADPTAPYEVLGEQATGASELEIS